MTRRFRATMLVAFLLPLFAAAPLTAQDYRGAFGIYGGGIWFSDFNDNGDFAATDLDLVDGLDEDFLFDRFADLSLETGWIAGAQAEYWFGNGRFGLRANGGYTERSFDLEFDDGFVDGDDDFFEDERDFGDVNTWLADGNVLIRILTPERDRTLSPFVNLGLGIVHYNPAGDQPIIIPEANAIFGDFGGLDVVDGNIVVDVDDGGNGETEFAGVLGLGTDIILEGAPVMFRLELADHIAFDSPARPLFALDEVDDEIVFGDADDDFDAVHNVRLTLGAHATFGRLFPEERVVAAPAPPPAPEPEPVEEAIRVCVVDPTIEGGVGYVDAIFLPETGDTLVVANGDRVPLREATGRAVVARDVDWYVRGEPLTLDVNGETGEFVTFGGGRIIQPDELAFLGTVNGLPVYAEADEAQDVAEELEEIRETQREGDLDDLLEQRDDLREDFEDIEILYVPLETTDCVFQPLERVEEVRKVRG